MIMKQKYIKNMSDWQRKLMENHPAMFEYLWRPPECNGGWYELLDKLMSDLECRIAESDEKVVLKVRQIKEKFGGLRFYADVECSKEMGEALALLIREAEAKSYSICEVCGSEGRLRRERVWMRTLCDLHDREAGEES